MDRIIKYKPSKEYEGKKVYEFLRDRGFSRQNITDLKYTESGIYVGEARIKLDYIITSDTELTVKLIENRSSEKIEPVDLPFDIVYEDEDLVIVNKPYGMPIHPSLNNYYNTLANAVAYYYGSQGKNFIYRCINRLDRDTTGLVVISKNVLSGNLLSQQHKAGKIYKEYVAIVCGEDIPDSGVIDKPIGRMDGSSIMRQIDEENGDCAITNYEVLGRGSNLALVKLWLQTGRTHQIRVHMSSIGHPLIGDFLYNPGNTLMVRQALHVCKIELYQPIEGTYISTRACIPDDMREIIDQYNIETQL